MLKDIEIKFVCKKLAYHACYGNQASWVSIESGVTRM